MFEDVAHLAPYISRSIYPTVIWDLENFRSVMLRGARQSGKSTLARQIARERNAVYVNLDFPEQLAAALSDPQDLASGSPAGLMVIDEVQRGGENLLLSIKTRLDRSNRPGQFLLTGSANYLTLPTFSETLQGRIAVEELHPFAQSELAGSAGISFVDAAFAHEFPINTQGGYELGTHDYWELIATGGYPEVQSRGSAFQSGWYRHYAETAVSREIIELGNISDRNAVMRVLNHCAARSGQELNVGSIAQAAKLARRTVTNYLEWLVSAHLITVVPPLGKILANRQIKSPKLLVSDSGLACHLAGSDAHGLAQRCDALRSQALETFVGNELFRQLGWSRTRARLRHWRVIQGAEVDFVLETSDGRVVGIEVEATTSPGRNAARRLGRLRDATVRRGGSFEHGYVLHLGRSSVHLGDRISAVPVAALWSTPQLPDDLTLIADATVRQAHTDTVVADLPLPALPAITIRIQPRNPREIRGFEFETLMVAGRLAQISELYPPVWDRIKVFRDYLGYRVVSDPGGDKELTVARLGLDGSGGIAVRVPGEPDQSECGTRPQPARIRPTYVYLALAAGCAALRAWTAGMTAVGGKAILSAQLVAPQSGIGLSVGPPQETLGPDPGTRIVKSDLGPLATEVDLEDWKSNAAQMMRSVRFLGEHLLAAFGYEGPGPVDDAGRFTEAGIEPEPRESLADTARLLGIECDWTNASVR